MKHFPFVCIAATLLLAAPAHAATDLDARTFAVTGTVPPICVGGTLSGASDVFDLGVLVDTATGLLRTDLSSPDKVLGGNFCSSRSTISIEAAPLVAQNFTASPAAGFSRSVDYVATASGWTDTAARFDTAATSNAAATQSRDTAFSGPITVGISAFATSGGNALRLVADTAYSGTVTVTLAPVS